MSFASLGLCAPATPGTSDEEADGHGGWLLVGEVGARTLSLLDCPSGRRLSVASLPQPLGAEPLLAPDRVPVAAGPEPARVVDARDPAGAAVTPGAGARGLGAASGTARDGAAPGRTLAHALLAGGELLSFELPSLQRVRSRSLPVTTVQPTKFAISAVDGGLLAAGGRGEEPLRIVDAQTLSDVHVYRPDRPTAIGALDVVPGRSSFLVGLAEPRAPAEVWELALDRNAPPVLKGLVHDYRMGESVPLPGRFTPRVSPVASPTAAFVPGPVPYEWLRIDTEGNASVLHLEVRREIARLPGAEGGNWLAAAWRAARGRGWLVGMQGARFLQVLESGSWRLGPRIALPAPLLAIRSFGDLGSIGVAVGPYPAARSEDPATGAEEQAAMLLVIDAGTWQLTQTAPQTASLVPSASSAPSAPSPPSASSAPPAVRLVPSQDGRCISLLDSRDKWLAAVTQRQ